MRTEVAVSRRSLGPLLTGLALLPWLPAALAAQQVAATRSAAKSAVAPPDQQIAAAVLAAPAEYRGSATVLGYGADGVLKELRKGSGPFVCLATDPAAAQFHVACYHRSLEPFMARGRALRAGGVTGSQVDTLRFEEIRAGRLALPKQPAALYSLTGPAGAFNPRTGTAPKARPLMVIYVPFATPESTGLPVQPMEGGAWIMNPGTPKAHIMFVPKM
jgi:hypothetical protein